MRTYLITRDDIEFSPAEVERLVEQGALLIHSAKRTVLVPRLAGGRGPDTKPMKALAGDAKSNSQWQMGQAQSQSAGAAEKEAQATALFQQPIDFWTGMASGDRTKMNAVAAPAITNLTNQAKAARESIMLQPRGVAQDYSLQQLPIQQAGQTANFLNQAYTSSFDKVADLGKTMADWGLQKTGAAARFGEGSTQSIGTAGNIYGDAAKADAAKKAATMGFLGDLTKTAAGPIVKGATALGKGIGGALGIGGGTAGTVAALPTYAGGAGGLSAAALTPGAPVLAGGGATAGTGAAAGGAAGAGGASSALSYLPGAGLMAAMIPIGGPNSDSLIAKGVNAWGDFLGSKFPDWMRGVDPYGKNWENYVYLLSNQPGGQTPTEEGFKEYMNSLNGVGG